MYALIDCDNFFVSCERIFQPRLKGRPVVVLSNNDGCVVARSYEAKDLGIPMGIPFFKIENMFKSAGGIALSSNYELYADISRRIMSLIRQEFGNLEIYSIDEAFVRLPDNTALGRTAADFHDKILRYVGVSVSIGIAPTKTLCKIAGEYAKKHRKIYILNNKELISAHLQRLDVADIWGIGHHTARKLNFIGIFTGEELRTAPLKMLRAAFGINLEKTALELNGRACLNISEEENSKSIICSRSFETEISTPERLEQIIAEFVDSACLRLRQKNAVAGGICVYISSNRFNPKHIQYQNSTVINLETPGNNTARFLHAMHLGLRQIFRPGILYKRAGITLLGLQKDNTLQPDLLSPTPQNDKERSLMRAFDAINAKLGRKSIYFGIQASGIKHYIRRRLKSSSYTTSWDGLAVVR